MEQTWADRKMQELEEKGRDNWNEEDYESYHYIEQLRFESGYYDDDGDCSYEGMLLDEDSCKECGYCER